MSVAQIQKFARVQDAFACPLCAAAMRLGATELRCEQGHAFSVAAKGYANFVPNQRPLKGYDRAFFEARRRFMDAGFYAHVLQAVRGALSDFDSAPRRILDVGCGEGYYARSLATGSATLLTSNADEPVEAAPAVFALDIAKDALQVAARGGTDVYWLVADLARVPLRPGSVDCIIDVFTPANYAEFARLLVPGGRVVKVVPGAEHLCELRHAARDHLAREEYSNERVADYFAAHFAIEKRVRATRTLPLDAAARRDLFAMTPLLFGVDDAALAALDISCVTIDAEVLVGVAR